jgi:hypothetical protein
VFVQFFFFLQQRRRHPGGFPLTQSNQGKKQKGSSQ